MVDYEALAEDHFEELQNCISELLGRGESWVAPFMLRLITSALRWDPNDGLFDLPGAIGSTWEEVEICDAAAKDDE